jgi:hypothetical protein
MDRLIADGTVPFGSHDTVPNSGTPGMATNGVPGITPRTIWPAYAWNMLSEEIRNAIVSAGFVPSGSNWTQLTQAVKKLCAFTITRRVLTVSQPYTPPAGLLFAEIWVQGAGGGGGASTGGGSSLSAGGGGGGGGLAHAVLSPVQIGVSQVVVIGAGGLGGPAGGNNGSIGGSTSFGGYLLANTGGAGFGAPPGAAGGPGSGGTIGGTVADATSCGGPGGHPGFVSTSIGSIASGIGGRGGDSRFGWGGNEGFQTDVTAAPSAVGFGAGGAGAGSSTSHIAGGVGGRGAVIIDEHVLLLP